MSSRIQFLLILFFTAQFALSQSLIRNSDFEMHRPLPGDFYDIYLPKHTMLYVEGWETGDKWAFYCHREYKRRFSEDAFKSTGVGYYFPDSMKIPSGEAMVKLDYHEAFLRPNIDTGGASYVTIPLAEPLVPGHVYKLSMWVNLVDNPIADARLNTHIGLYLSLKRPLVKYGGMIYTDYFFTRELQPNQWIYVEHYILALCALKHLTVGAFRDDSFPSHHRMVEGVKSCFYVDDVDLVKIDETILPDSIEPTPYCEFYEKEAKSRPSFEEREINIYFDSDQSELDEKDRSKLDSFYAETEAEKGYCYLMTGHTDNEGVDNYNLSVARLTSVEGYMKQKFGLSEYKFISFPRADWEPVGNNQTTAGKQLNRRVTVKTTTYPTHTAVYRRGILYLNKGDFVNAARLFKIWINTIPQPRRIEILHDVRLNALKETIYWKQLVTEVRRGYENYIKPEHAFFLDSMFWVDQRHRTYAPRMLTGYYPGLDTFDLSAYRIDIKDLSRIDSINYIPLKKYIAGNGFPKISEVGRRQVKTACYMIIHNLDTAMMRKYLPVLELRCTEGEAEWFPYAIMLDKYRLIQGLPQLYGMQYEAIDEAQTKFKLYQFDNLELVNDRRRKIGIGPITNPDEVITMTYDQGN